MKNFKFFWFNKKIIYFNGLSDFIIWFTNHKKNYIIIKETSRDTRSLKKVRILAVVLGLWLLFFTLQIRKKMI